MSEISLAQLACLLAAAAIAAPIARWLRVGAVLGYLMAGILIGPYGIGQVFSLYKAQEILHVGEAGVIFLLFILGLELKPIRLWSMRHAIFGFGSAQVGLSALALLVVGYLLDLPWQAGLFAALALSLSSTAFAIQVLEEREELTTRHGRLAFSVLLFQDIAAIPLIALVPLFAVVPAAAVPQMTIAAALFALGTIALIVLIGFFVLDRILQFIAHTKVKEAMTAAALLTVVGVAGLMHLAGLSPSLGAFIAGVLVAESAYRHQLEADIKPFEGLLLGLFFTAIGMSLNLTLIVNQPLIVFGLLILLLVIKTGIVYLLGLRQSLGSRAARRLALFINQGGEFAFVLFAAGATAGVLAVQQANLLNIVVTLSMVATPLLLILDDVLTPKPVEALPAYDDLPPDADRHVIIAGFGRFGQIVGRILRAKRVPFTALDSDPAQVATVARFGGKAFYGDASRLEVLHAAQAGKARLFVLAVSDAEQSVATAALVRHHFPDLPIFARARDRHHVHRLMDLGVVCIRREMFLASLDLTREVLKGLGYSARDVEFAVDTFARHDEQRLVDDYRHATDLQKLQELARTDAEMLAQLFDEDARSQDETASDASDVKETA